MRADLSSRMMQLRKAYTQRSGREKIWMVLAVVALIVGLWDSLIHLPMQNKTAQIKQQTEQSQQQSAQMQQAIRLLQSQVGETSAEKQQRLEALQQQVAATQDRLQAESSGLVSPERMAKVLKQVLAQTQGVELLKLKTLPPQPWSEVASPDAPLIYQHGIEMQLQGDYFAILNYLQLVEAQAGFDWESMDYQVRVWPTAQVTIRLHTLGLEEAMLGA